MAGWVDHAACAGMDVDVFFLSGFESQALAVCASCPVRLQCLDAGLEETDGVWGGLTPKRRRSERTRRRRMARTRRAGASQSVTPVELARLLADARAAGRIR